MAVLEKGKAPGSHLLSGAVVNPRGLQRLFQGRKRIDEMPFYGRGRRRVGAVPDEAAARCGSRRRRRWSTTATTSRRSRSSAAGSRRRRRRSARRSCPETSAERSCSSTAAASSACARATAGAGGRARSSANFEPGSDVTARVTILAEGTQGHLTGAALDRFGLASENPQVWALGVKEVWKVAKPLDRVDPHDGLAAARRREVPRVRRLVRLPDGRGHGHDRDGRRARLPRRGAVGARPAAGAEDASARSGGSSKAASGCSGARRRFPRAGSSRCRSGSMRRGCCSAATASAS